MLISRVIDCCLLLLLLLPIIIVVAGCVYLLPNGKCKQFRNLTLHFYGIILAIPHRNSISGIYYINIYIVLTLFVVIMKQLNKLGKLLVILPQTKANDERTVPCGNVACGELWRIHS